MQEIKNRLIELFRTKSLQIGHFTLTSGVTSNYYLDGKRTTLAPEGAYLSACLILEELKRRGIKAEAIGGLTLGADPIVAAVAAVSYAKRTRYRPLSAFIVRKRPKRHGTQRYIEGFDGFPEAPVIIIDDVCTTGNSAAKAIKHAEQAGYHVVAVICLVDREQGAKKRLHSYPFFPLLTASDLLNEAKIQKRLARL